MKLGITLMSIFFSTICFGHENAKTSCNIMKHGTFKYLDAIDSSAFIIMANGKQTEHSKINNYIIESEIKWTSDCSYVMKMTKITVPDFPYQPGDVMEVKIDKVEGDVIYYTSTVNNNSWKGRFRKIKD